MSTTGSNSQARLFMKQNRTFPNRHQNSVLEAESERYFRNRLPTEWIVDKPSDYGIDMIVSPVLGGNVIGLNFSVQLKAQNDVKGKWEVRLKKTTLNYLFNRLEPVMIVIYNKKANEGRWKWLLPKDFDLTKNAASYSVRFNQQQTFSTIDWNTISDFVQQVFKVKNQLLTSLEYDLFNTHSELEGKAWSHYFGNNPDEATFYFKRLIQNPNPKAIWFLALAQSQYQTYDYRNAIININRAIEINSDDTILLTKGCILAEDGIRNNDPYKLTEAEKIFADLFARAPNAVHAYNLANTISKLNKLNEAEKLYKFALKQVPNYVEAWKNLGQVYYELRKHEQEIKCYDKALSIKPDLFQATISKAITNGFIYSKYRQSIKVILSVIEKHPPMFSEFPVIYYWLGFFYFKIRNINEALNWINRGLSNNPGDRLLINLKANILFEAIEQNDGLLSDAISFFAANYRRNDRDPVNFYYLCTCVEKHDNEQKAYEMAISWLNNQSFTNAFQNFSKYQLSYSQAMQMIRHWVSVQSYIGQYPIERLQLQLEDAGITKLENFLQSFEISRFLLLCNVIDLLNKSSSPKIIRENVSKLFHQFFFGIPEEEVCSMITVYKANLQEFAKQFASVTVAICNLYLVECSRCVGFIIGQRNIEKEKKILNDVVDPSLYQATLLYYTEVFYRHFELPMD